MTSHTAPSTPLATPTEVSSKVTKMSKLDEASQVLPVEVSISTLSSPIVPSNAELETAIETPMTTAAVDLETYLHQTLNLCNKLAKTSLDDPALTVPASQGSVMGFGSEVAAAKMLNYCIRMLHADGWHPPTVIRAMVLRECGLEAGMKTTLYKALRERRQEIKVGEAKKAGVVDEGVATDVEKSTKKNVGKGTGRRSTLPGKGRKGRAMTANGADAQSMVTDRKMHQVRVEDGRDGPFISLI